MADRAFTRFGEIYLISILLTQPPKLVMHPHLLPSFSVNICSPYKETDYKGSNESYPPLNSTNFSSSLGHLSFLLLL